MLNLEEFNELKQKLDPKDKEFFNKMEKELKEALNLGKTDLSKTIQEIKDYASNK